MAKFLFKSCPHCRFKKCWIKANQCEKCGYDFILGKKPRAKNIVITDEDLELPPPPKEEEKPKFKKCPDCKTDCWHAAPFCDNCDYNFRTGETKLQKVDREQRELEKTKIKETVNPRSLTKLYFGMASAACYAVATGGYGSKVVDRNSQILALKPPTPAKATYNNVAQWIQHVQEYGSRQNDCGLGGVEYTISALNDLVSLHLDRARKRGHDVQKTDYRKIRKLIREIYENLEAGIPLTFIPEEVEVYEELVPAGHHEEEEPVPSKHPEPTKPVKKGRRRKR